MTGQRCAFYWMMRAVPACVIGVLLCGGCAEEISGDGPKEDPVKRVVDSVYPANVERPAWIGTDSLVFSWDQDPEIDQLFVVNVNGGHPVRFISDGTRHYLHPAWSPDLNMVAFEVYGGGLGAPSDVDAKSVAGTARKVYVSAAQSGSATFPSWGPDGTSLGYLTPAPARFVMIELDTSRPLPGITGRSETILLEGTQVSRPAWYAPSGGEPFSGRVAFNRAPPNAQTGTAIYYYDLDSETLVQLTDEDSPDGSNDNNPSWSPDGRHIVYSSRHSADFRNELYIVSVETKAVSRITRTGDDEKEPSWSPDGKRIAYVSEGDLYVLTLDQSLLPE